MGLFAPNATGKSSLFDAISFCLYDKSSRAYKAANILNNRKSDFVCHLHFQIDGLDYHIERTAKTINKGKNVKVDVQFWRQDGDDRTSLNGTERRDTNTIIEQYVGTYEDFVLTALSLQGNNALFIDKSQSERKDLLAQFMGLNVFDKLYETATEDIKEVSVLIKNFKKTDFTTELADKANELKDEKAKLKDLEKELGRLNTDSTDLADRIVGLSRELTPIDGNLNLESLTKSEGELGRDILHILAEKKAKGIKIEEYVNLIAEVSQSIEENKTINNLPIEEAKREWDLLKDQINDTLHQIELLENGIEHNKEKLAHLEQHEYDPN
jgi:DNA repair exonuclease SbcCD ATPase subunit